MGSQTTSTQIEPFPLVACNGWGLGCPINPTRMTVGNNLGAFRVIQSRNKCNDLKPALVRAIPFHRNYPKLRHVKGHICFFLHVLIIKRILVYFDFQWKNKYCEKIWKKRSYFVLFCVKKFYDMIKIQKIDCYLFEQLNFKKMQKRRKF